MVTMNIFNTLQQGDSIAWDDDPYTDARGERYDSSSYDLVWELRGPSKLTLDAVANGSGWTTTLTAAQSSSLLPGRYAFAAYLKATNVRITVAQGNITITPDLSLANVGYDARTLAERSLADAEAALANLTASGKKMKQYSIGSRSATYYTASELIQAIQYWKMRVNSEKHGKSTSNGLGVNLKTRFI